MEFNDDTSELKDSIGEALVTFTPKMCLQAEAYPGIGKRGGGHAQGERHLAGAHIAEGAACLNTFFRTR